MLATPEYSRPPQAEAGSSTVSAWSYAHRGRQNHIPSQASAITTYGHATYYIHTGDSECGHFAPGHDVSVDLAKPAFDITYQLHHCFPITPFAKSSHIATLPDPASRSHAKTRTETTAPFLHDAFLHLLKTATGDAKSSARHALKSHKT